ncbi:ABC transporter ATP-binding protein [Catenulispora sp. NF23]|uniref:ABC transporter ATP-binding protein n=1 Tax=Catenulispora pinistramenti TaxID=2705254 RepID=A0ABS5KRH6_9ACTN|nr:ABC transporter ATP-binding protein [Catenulispora pinistramenti]MBS2548651.1 ABC transporter ATP-binding protein [Catenulispora pinistramenti]
MIVTSTEEDPVVRLDGVHKTYGKGAGAVPALRGLTLDFAPGTFTAVMGPSGAGKSTFLHCAAGLDRPDAGSVVLGGTDLASLSEVELTLLRRERVGFVFQAYNLMTALSVADNITLPLMLADRRPDRSWLHEVAERVGLADRMRHKPAELSGGQQQRVAIARALAARPEVVFADEPTGALDTRTARQVLQLLRDVVDDLGQTVVMVTHDPVAASYAHRVVFLADGRYAQELARPTADSVAERMTSLGQW